MRQVLLSSLEEELVFIFEYISCDDVEIESESVSEKGKYYILIIYFFVIDQIGFFFQVVFLSKYLIDIIIFILKVF